MRRLAPIAAAIFVLSIAGPVSAQGDPEPSVAADAMAEGGPEQAMVVLNTPTDPDATGVELLDAEHAVMTRLPDRIVVEVRMRTPEPGSYRYALSVPPERWAAPEVFTGWLFVFNHPEHCVSSKEPPRCGPRDFVKRTRAGVYNVGAHVSSISHHGGPFVLDEGTDGYVVISGEILVGAPPLRHTPPDPAVRIGLEEPLTAEVHLAIVSHGQLDPATLPGELYEAEGVPTCDCWWLAMWLGTAPE